MQRCWLDYWYCSVANSIRISVRGQNGSRTTCQNIMLVGKKLPLSSKHSTTSLMHNFLYSLTIYLLHYYPRHVSSFNMAIFRRKNCIITASGIFALCKRLHSTLVESGLLQRAKISDSVWIQFFLLKMGMLMFETCRG